MCLPGQQEVRVRTFFFYPFGNQTCRFAWFPVGKRPAVFEMGHWRREDWCVTAAAIPRVPWRQWGGPKDIGEGRLTHEETGAVVLHDVTLWNDADRILRQREAAESWKNMFKAGYTAALSGGKYLWAFSMRHSPWPAPLFKEGKGQPRKVGGDLEFKLKRVRLYLAISSAGCGGLH